MWFRFHVCGFGFNEHGFGFNVYGFGFIFWFRFQWCRLRTKVLTSVTYLKVKTPRDFRVGFFCFLCEFGFNVRFQFQNWYLGILESSA